jgi:hypothetical protein
MTTATKPLHECYAWRVVPNEDPETNQDDEEGPAYPWSVLNEAGECWEIYTDLAEAIAECKEYGEQAEAERLANEISGVTLEDQPLAIVQAIAKLLDVE